MSVMMYLVSASLALAVGGPAYPIIRAPRGAVRKGRSASSIFAHIGWFSQTVVAPTLYPPSLSHHRPNCSFARRHLRNSLAAFCFFEHLMLAWEKATLQGDL